MIDIKNLDKHYQLSRKQRYALATDTTKHKALNNISFQCEAGKVLLVLGTKNSGKSSLLQIIAGMLPFDKGTVTVMGMDVATAGNVIRKKTAMITAQPSCYEYLTVKEHLAYFGRLNGLSAQELKEALPRQLQKWELQHLAKTTLRKLSDVERRYLSIAQSLMHEPDLLLLDEPTLGLDVFTAQPFVELLKYAKSTGKTVVFSTNNISKAELLGDSVLVLDKGSLIHQSEMSEFKKLAGGNSAKAFLDIIANANSTLITQHSALR